MENVYFLFFYVSLARYRCNSLFNVLFTVVYEWCEISPNGIVYITHALVDFPLTADAVHVVSA